LCAPHFSTCNSRFNHTYVRCVRLKVCLGQGYLCDETLECSCSFRSQVVMSLEAQYPRKEPHLHYSML
jgi:hypothetical protein